VYDRVFNFWEYWDDDNYGVKDNLFFGNTFLNNNRVFNFIHDYAQVKNTIYANNFINNSQDVISPCGENLWDNGTIGNFWDSYDGSDNDYNGIGDTPKSIDEGINDSFPLMNPYGPPYALFDFEVNNRSVDFNASYSGDYNGEILNYQWDFGDNSTSNESIVTHNYTSDGYYTVSLTVTDDENISDEYTKVVVVGDLPTVFADFDFNPSNILVNDQIFFTDLSYSLGGSLVNWSWSFDDGSVSYLKNPVHQYTSPGTYTVCLNVTDDVGASDEVCKQLMVVPSVVSQLVSNLTVGWNCVALPVNQSMGADDMFIMVNDVEYSWSEACSSGLLEPSVFMFNSTTQQYQYMLSDGVVLDPGQGYWFYAYESCALWVGNVSGSAWNNSISALVSGWNNIGIPINETVTLGELLVEYDDTEYNWSEACSSGLLEPSVFMFNSTTQQYQYVMGDDAILIPGQGYWFYSYESCWLKMTS